MRITDLLPPAPIANVQHADVLLELAFLMASADGQITEEERRALGDVLGRIRREPKGPATDAEIEALVRRFSENIADRPIADRVRQLGMVLPPDLREAAFKLAIGIALADRHAAADEEALMDVFFEALGLDRDRAEALAEEARRVGP